MAMKGKMRKRALIGNRASNALVLYIIFTLIFYTAVIEAAADTTLPDTTKISITKELA